jgi:neopullulanase
MTSDFRKFQSIFYVLVDRFQNGDPSNDNGLARDTRDLADLRDHEKWHGGDFLGISQKASYIATLGFKAVMISPFEQQVAGVAADGRICAPFHGFHPNRVSQFNLEPHFGGFSELAEMMDALRGVGLQVLGDTVPNHRGYESPDLYQFPELFHMAAEIEAARQTSAERLFEVEWFSGLPDLKQSSPQVRELLDRYYRLMVGYGFVGFRLDAMQHCDRDWVEHLAQGVCKDIDLVGEIYHGDPLVHRPYWQLGVATTSHHLHFALTEELSKGGNAPNVGRISGMVANILATVPSHGQLLNFWDNHDSTRGISSCLLNGVSYADALDRVDLGLTLAYTLPGTPIVVYGTEAGLEGLGLTEVGRVSNRPDMRFGGVESSRLYKRICALNQLRDNHAVGYGEYRELYTGYGVLAFVRFVSGHAPVLVVLNAWDREVNLASLPGQISVQPFAESGELVELTGRQHEITVEDGKLVGTLPPRTAYVLSPAA